MSQNSSDKLKKILIVEDQAILAMAEAETLEHHGFTALAVYSGEEAIEVVDSDSDIDLILMDIDLGQGMDGTAAAQQILQRRHIPIVFLSSHTEPDIVRKTEEITAYGYVVKNSGETVLINSIKMAFKLYNSFKKEREHDRLMGAIISASPISIFGINPEGKVILWNESSQRLFGWKAEEIEGTSLPIIPEFGTDDYRKRLEAHREGHYLFRHKVMPKKKDGTLFHASLSTAPLHDDEGKLLGVVALTEDITQQVESENRFQAMVEHSPDAMFIQTDLHFAYVNPATVKLFGASSASELIGAPIMDRIHSDFHAEALRRIGVMTRDQIPITRSLEQQYQRQDGTWIWVEATGIPIMYMGKRSILTTVREITERKQREQELRDNRESLRITLNSIGDAVISTDVKGLVVQINRVAAAMTGWKSHEAIGTPLNEVFHIINADTRTRIINPVDRVLRTGKVVGLANHTILIAQDGREYQIADSAAPIYNDDGEVRGVVLVFRDVTEQSEAEQQLRETELRWQLALDNAGDGLWDWNAETNTVFFSTKWKELLGYREEEIENSFQEWESRIHPEDRDQCLRDLRKHLDGQTPVYENIHRLRCKNGDYKWILDRGCVVSRFEDGRPQRVVGTHFDLTESKKTEGELRRALKEKDFLMREINHRIKNNLTIITSLLRLEESELFDGKGFADIISRIDAIRIVHEKLNQTAQSGEISQINFKDYIQDLLETLFSSFSDRPVAIENSSEEILLSAKTGVALGLITNEVAVNALKHGFREQHSARFSVDFRKCGTPEEYCLTLSNNGTPIPETVELDSPRTMGLRLIETLSAQLRGTAHLQKTPHPVFTLRFPVGNGE